MLSSSTVYLGTGVTQLQLSNDAERTTTLLPRILILEGSLIDELDAKHRARPIFPPPVLEIEDMDDIGNIIFKLATGRGRRFDLGPRRREFSFVADVVELQ